MVAAAAPVVSDYVQQLERFRAQLELGRSSWLQVWKDLTDFVLPRRGRFSITDTNKGTQNTSKINDTAATLAARVLSAGMMSGITSPARPWFRLSVPDPDLADDAEVKRWLYVVESRMREVFTKSNTYNVLPGVYTDLGVYGTSAMAVIEDEQDVIRCYRYPIGTYFLANGERQKVDSFVREYQRTARQLVQEFGSENCSDNVRSAMGNTETETLIDVVHVVKPNPAHDPSKLNAKHKRWSSCYYEKASASSGKLLKESGFDEFPIMAPRWHTDGEDVYGSGPGMDALPDIKALQTLQKRRLQAVEKKVNPPLVGPSSLEMESVSMLPGGITYLDEREGFKGLRALHDVNFQTQDITAIIGEHTQRIDRTFFVDLFLLNSMIQGGQPVTAEEIRARQEEKLLMLGPVLERVIDELLEPLIDRTFAIMHRRGMIPEAPEQLQGVTLKVECISILAAAQKLLGIGGIDRLLGVIGAMGAVDPTAYDKLDRDKAIDHYADSLGVPPDIMRSDDEVEKIRGARAQQAQAQQQQVDVAQNVEAAKVLSETDTSGDNALTDILRASTGVAP